MLSGQIVYLRKYFRFPFKENQDEVELDTHMFEKLFWDISAIDSFYYEMEGSGAKRRFKTDHITGEKIVKNDIPEESEAYVDHVIGMTHVGADAFSRISEFQLEFSSDDTNDLLLDRINIEKHDLVSISPPIRFVPYPFSMGTLFDLKNVKDFQLGHLDRRSKNYIIYSRAEQNDDDEYPQLTKDTRKRVLLGPRIHNSNNQK